MSEFIIRVVVNVLWHFHVEHLESRRVGWIAAAAGNFTCVWNASQLVVLHPKVRLEDFGRGCEAEKRSIAGSELSAFLFGTFLGENQAVAAGQRNPESAYTRCERAFLPSA